RPEDRAGDREHGRGLASRPRRRRCSARRHSRGDRREALNARAMDQRRSAPGLAWGALVLALVAACGQGSPVVGAGSNGPRTDPNPEDVADFGALPDFHLVDERGNRVGLADLAGHPLVIGALFSTCAGPCPSIARSLKHLQDELAPTDVRLVVVTVDPEFDTPEVLASYAKR